MRSLPESTKLPAPIAEAKAILHERGAFGRYPSKNALNVGLDLYACIFPRIHELTVEIARLPARPLAIRRQRQRSGIIRQ